MKNMCKKIMVIGSISILLFGLISFGKASYAQEVDAENMIQPRAITVTTQPQDLENMESNKPTITENTIENKKLPQKTNYTGYFGIAGVAILAGIVVIGIILRKKFAKK